MAILKIAGQARTISSSVYAPPLLKKEGAVRKWNNPIKRINIVSGFS